MDIVKSLIKAKFNQRPKLYTILAALFGIYLLNKITTPKRKCVVGKVVLITGAGSGLGRIFAQRFAGLGAKLALLDVNAKGLEETVSIIGLPASSVQTFVCDITNSEKIRQVREKINSTLGPVDILLNNAGIVAGKYIEELTEADMRRTMDVNSLAPMLLTSIFFPDMLKRGSGHVVTVASAAAYMGVLKLTDYCASKAAAQRFTDALREEIRMRSDISNVARSNLIATSINPYFINTGMFQGVKTVPFLLPLLTPDSVVDEAMDTILRNKATMNTPALVNVAPLLTTVLPRKLQNVICNFLGVSSSMENFTGRSNRLAIYPSGSPTEKK